MRIHENSVLIFILMLNLRSVERRPQEELICRASLLPVEEIPTLGPKTWILGEPVLRKYYSAYDWKNQP